MSDLKSMFTTRDKFFFDKTLEIFNKIDSTLSATTTFLSDIDEMISIGTIVWEDASLIDELVIIIGVVQYDVGTKLKIAGKEIEMTEDNVEQFNRVLHMSVPYDLVVQGDYELILEFLYEMGATEEEKLTIEGLATVNYNDKDFDLTQLSDEQRAALALFEKKTN